MRTILYYVTLVVATVWYGGKCIVAGFLRIRRVRGGVYDRAQRYWARAILKASGVRVEVGGGGAERLEPGRALIIASNHTSFFDILAYLGHLPVDPKFITKKELFAVPVFGGAIRAAGHVRLDRHHPKEAFGAYEAAARRVREEQLPILVYPEGTRTRTGELLPFKKGPFVLAIACGAPILPAYVEGAFGILPKGKIRVRPQPIRILIGEPIPTAGLTVGDRDELSGLVREAVLALKARAETRTLQRA